MCPKQRGQNLRESRSITDVVILAMTSHWIPEGGGRVSEIGCSKSSGNISKPRMALLQGGEDDVIM
jgi:hypothetical protein